MKIFIYFAKIRIHFSFIFLILFFSQTLAIETVELGEVHLSLQVTASPKIFIKKSNNLVSTDLELKNHPQNIFEYQITEPFLVKLTNSSEYQLKLKTPLILEKQRISGSSSAQDFLKAEVRWGKKREHLKTLTQDPLFFKQENSLNNISEETYFLNISTQANKSIYGKYQGSLILIFEPMA